MNDYVTDINKTVKAMNTLPKSNHSTLGNTRRALGIAVFILGVSGCGDASLPAEAESALIDYMGKGASNIKIQFQGKGKPLPMDVARGVDTVLCVTIHYDKESRPNQSSSFVMRRIGNRWDVSWGGYKREWDENSCPGIYLEK